MGLVMLVMKDKDYMEILELLALLKEDTTDPDWDLFDKENWDALSTNVSRIHEMLEEARGAAGF